MCNCALTAHPYQKNGMIHSPLACLSLFSSDLSLYSFTDISNKCIKSLGRKSVLNFCLMCSFCSGGPLHLGDIEDLGEAALPCVVCPWHSWKYSLETGSLKIPDKKNITLGTYPVRVNEKGEVYLGVINGAVDF